MSTPSQDTTPSHEGQGDPLEDFLEGAQACSLEDAECEACQ